MTSQNQKKPMKLWPYATNLVQAVLRENKLDPVIGRDEEIRDVIRIPIT